MEATLINLNDYVHVGEGFNGESYYHRTDPSIMLKLYNASASKEMIVNELSFSRKVFRLGIPTPKPGEFVTDGKGRYGIRFERILDKISFSRAAGEEPERCEEYARRFAKLCKRLHSIHVDTTQFASVKQADLNALTSNPFFTEDEKKRVVRFIENAPDAETAVHGDLQYSNAIMSPRGDFFIDLGNFCYGHPYFDLGQVMLCCCISPDEFIRENFHMEPETAKLFWAFFADEYFGKGIPLKEINELISPYSGLMSILIDNCCNCRMEVFHAYLPK
ncbi:MAG: TIGR02172 family protein [Bacteroidales bacterium]|nr:TIGR02172 family protein [Bacteroidales bacterium]